MQCNYEILFDMMTDFETELLHHSEFGLIKYHAMKSNFEIRILKILSLVV
jgi:hypothetical protein